MIVPYLTPVLTAWLSVAAAASWQHFVVRRQLRKSESEKRATSRRSTWVAHEMRTPLTAIQGSSELMSRYKLTEEKRKQMSDMINSESKRLARMIQTFLDVERLADGQMELKREVFPAAELVDALHGAGRSAGRSKTDRDVEWRSSEDGTLWAIVN